MYYYTCGSNQWRITYLVGVELFSVHWCRVFNHHQRVISKTLTVEVLGVGKIEKLLFQDFYANIIQGYRKARKNQRFKEPLKEEIISA